MMAKTVQNCENQNGGSKINHIPEHPIPNKGFPRIEWLRKNIAIVSICALCIVIILLTSTILVLLKRQSTDAGINAEEDKLQEENQNRSRLTTVPSPLLDSDSRGNLTLSDKFTIVSRLEWLAQPPVEPANPLHVPVPYVIIHHTSTENCSSQAQCVFYARYIQIFHIESRNWWDIGYNFLVGGDGKAYEGRGWRSEGAHACGYNAKSIGIAFIGTFNSLKPPERQITACKQLIAEGVKMGYIRKDYKLLAVRQLATTHSPGAALYEELKTWEHWSPTP